MSRFNVRECKDGFYIQDDLSELQIKETPLNNMICASEICEILNMFNEDKKKLIKNVQCKDCMSLLPNGECKHHMRTPGSCLLFHYKENKYNPKDRRLELKKYFKENYNITEEYFQGVSTDELERWMAVASMRRKTIPHIKYKE